MKVEAPGGKSLELGTAHLVMAGVPWGGLGS